MIYLLLRLLPDQFRAPVRRCLSHFCYDDGQPAAIGSPQHDRIACHQSSVSIV